MIIEISRDNFNTKVLESSIPVLVEFWASWCGACKWIEPMIHQLAEDVRSKAKVFAIDVEQEPELSKKYNIVTVPTIIVFNDGEIMNKVAGFRDKNDLRGLLGV